MWGRLPSNATPLKRPYRTSRHPHRRARHYEPTMNLDHHLSAEAHQRVFSVGPAPPEQALRAELTALLTRWEQRSKRKFADAKTEPTEHGRRFIEHGAVNLFNCAAELQAVLERQAGNAARDLGLEVVQKHAERP